MELIFVHKIRDAEDHIAWLIQHGWHEKALAAVEAGQGRTELLDEVILQFDQDPFFFLIMVQFDQDHQGL